jgi:transposase
MRTPIFVRELSPDERRALESGLRSADAFTLRRCQILLASAKGLHAIHIAHNLQCDDQTVRNAIHDFNLNGLASLTPGSSRPHTTRAAFDEAGVERLRALLHQSPRTFGKATSVWTLPLAAEVGFAEGVTRTLVSGETIRQALKRLKVGWKRAKRWITSPDPAYVRKKSNVTGSSN